MNKQGPNGIEWTQFSWNPVSGCHHACTWTMPDGRVAECYAKTVAERVAMTAYPEGFAHHYWHPERLEEPLKVKKPARIFLDSMSDLMGAWVPDEQIEDVLDICRRASWHQFQLLTKNAPRLLKFNGRIPSNVWVGVSAPPSSMLGGALDLKQQLAYVYRAIKTLALLDVPITWLSLEPLSFDMGAMLNDIGLDMGAFYGYNWLQWVVIGAASNGKTIYHPEPQWVKNAVEFARRMGAKVFFKGNLRANPAADPWLAEFPEVGE